SGGPFPGSSQQPDPAVTRGRAELEDALGARVLDQQIKQHPFVRVDDGNVFAMRFLFHARQHAITWWHETVEILLKGVGHLNCSHRDSSKYWSSRGCSETMYSVMQLTALRTTSSSRRAAGIVS